MKVLLLLFIFFNSLVFAQKNNFIEHKVMAKETVFSIAKKYKVTPSDIYKWNPDTKNGVQENSVLIIPKSGFESNGMLHKVQPKETLFSIAKKYKVKVSDIEKWNKEALTEGLKTDQEIYVSKPSSSKKAKNTIKDKVEVVKDANSDKVALGFSHTVAAKETKYGIATKYGISVEELEKLNPQIGSELQVGDVLKIRANQERKDDVVENQYEVQPKETLFSLTKKLNLTQEELLVLNPNLKDGLKEGMVLNLPSKKMVRDSILSSKVKKDLLLTVDRTTQKELVMLLPFNLNKIENDSLKSKTEHLKTNKFLNLTLDYYAGALMAIDSAKVLGLPVTVKIYDVESSKFSSNIASIIAKHDFSNVDAVIGPFQNSHVENTAQLLSKYDIPVISPLSKEKGLALPNLYYAIPSEDRLKDKLFSYFKQKEANVVAIISTKKTSSTEYLTANYPKIKHAVFNEKGALDLAHLKTQLVKGKPNFVLLEIENSGKVLAITNSLKNLQKEYDIQLVVFEVYDALNFIEIPIKNLTALKMMYPSASKVLETPEDFIFAKEFKNDNNVAPNAAAIKGFDITFDTILRICQEEGFVASVSKYKTEYVGNSFDYSIENGANNNNGCFLLYYDNDLTIKKVQ